MSQTRLIIIGQPSSDVENLRARFTEITKGVVHHFAEAKLALQSISTSPATLVGFSFNLFNREKIDLLSQFRELGHEMPVLVYARNVTKDAYAALHSISNVVVLEAPCERKRLVAVTQKLITGDDVRQQFHRRFVTNQSVRVEPFRADSTTSIGRIRNLSAGGAFIECADATLSVGELVRFHVHLNELQKKHVMSAQIMWRSESETGYGVSFMKSGEVYQNLLKRM